MVEIKQCWPPQYEGEVVYDAGNVGYVLVRERRQINNGQSTKDNTRFGL